MIRLGSRCVPALLARDLDETIRFYRDVLGFALTGDTPGEDYRWIELTRDEVVLQFHHPGPAGTPRDPVLSGTLYFLPENVRALADEWRGRVEFAWGPEIMPYGMREFGILDPNGYFLAFTEPVEGDGDP